MTNNIKENKMTTQEIIAKIENDIALGIDAERFPLVNQQYIATTASALNNNLGVWCEVMEYFSYIWE